MAEDVGVQFLPPLGPRPAESHKGNYGSLLMIAGSRGMAGAAALASLAALRAGAGLVRLACPEPLNDVIQSKLAEVITIPMPASPTGTFSLKALDELLRIHELYDAVCLGPGFGLNEHTRPLVRSFVMACRKPIVIDADALNALAGGTDSLGAAAAPRVITPHPGEMARLLGTAAANILAEPSKIAVEFAAKYGIIVALKMHRTVVTDGKTIYTNTTGNPGMATAGAGDVLAGTITAFIGQGIEPLKAAALGVYLHGLAGDIAKSRKGEVSMIASDILDALPDAILQYQKKNAAVIV